MHENPNPAGINITRMSTPDYVGNPRDLYVWSDGHWCFRFELPNGWTRDDECRAVPYESEQWQKLSQRLRNNFRDMSQPSSTFP